MPRTISPCRCNSPGGPDVSLSSWRRESRERACRILTTTALMQILTALIPAEGGGRGQQYVSQRAACDPLGVPGPCGLYPGLMCGPFTTEGYSTTDPSWRPFIPSGSVSPGTFDAGARLIIPIWRFQPLRRLHLSLLPRPIIPGREFRPSRSYMGLGVGLSFNFFRSRIPERSSVTRSLRYPVRPSLPEQSGFVINHDLLDHPVLALPVVFRLEVLTEDFRDAPARIPPRNRRGTPSTPRRRCIRFRGR